VLFLAKEIEKRLANLRRGHGAEIKRTFRRMRELLPMEQERQAPILNDRSMCDVAVLGKRLHKVTQIVCGRAAVWSPQPSDRQQGWFRS